VAGVHEVGPGGAGLDELLGGIRQVDVACLQEVEPPALKVAVTHGLQPVQVLGAIDRDRLTCRVLAANCRSGSRTSLRSRNWWSIWLV